MHRGSTEPAVHFSFYIDPRTEVRTTGKYRYLTFEDRKKIEAWHARGDRPLEIAARLGVHTATIYHELQRGYTGEVDAAQREIYSAERAQAVVRENFKRRGRRGAAQASGGAEQGGFGGD